MLSDEEFARCEAQAELISLWVEYHVVGFAYRVARVSTEFFIFYLTTFIFPMWFVMGLVLCWGMRSTISNLCIGVLERVIRRWERE